MERRALIVGVDEYHNFRNLSGCVADAGAMKDILTRHYDGAVNYSCRLLTTKNGPVTRAGLREAWNTTFENFDGEILFYFSGHGAPTEVGGHLVTQDATRQELGLPMDELLTLAINSKAREVLLMLDCCHAGAMGNAAVLQGNGASSDRAILREGLTILAASGPSEAAIETNGHGLFTWLVLNALGGGAADVRGQVSAASIYSYVEQALGPWDQRPLYKSYAKRLSPIRSCKPAVPDSLLRELPSLFPEVTYRYQLDPTYEASDASAIPEHTAIYQKFTVLRDARLLRTVGGNHLFFTVMGSGAVELTELGQLYWLQAKNDRL